MTFTFSFHTVPAVSIILEGDIDTVTNIYEDLKCNIPAILIKVRK